MEVAEERRDRLRAERRRVRGEGASSSSLWEEVRNCMGDGEEHG